jgi:hypothetical protein
MILFGPAENGHRHANPKGVGGLEVQDQLDSGGLLHGQVGRLDTL